MNQFLFALGLVIVIFTGISILFSMVLPRSPRGIERATLLVNKIVRLTFMAVSRLTHSYEKKDTILASTGPVAIVAQLIAWAAIFIIGFGLMLYGTTHNFADAFLQAAAGLFTVGSVSAGGVRDTAIDVAAGAIWIIVVTLQIAYLPTLYSAFNRREGLVALLESRSGVPAWGPEVLARHQLVGITDTLPEFYASWEQWSADLAESHTTYPVLLLFRSPEPWLSWLVGLLSVLDAAAMHLALAPSRAPSQARLCLRMGFTALNRIAKTLGWIVNPDPDPTGPIALTFDEFEQAVGMLQRIRFPMERTAAEAWPDFVGWRVNYETTAYRLTKRLTAPPARWSGPRLHLPPESIPPRRPPQRSPRKVAFDGQLLPDSVLQGPIGNKPTDNQSTQPDVRQPDNK